MEHLPSHCNSEQISPISQDLTRDSFLRDLLHATAATVADYSWEFQPAEGKSSSGFCCLHTQSEAAAACFHTRGTSLLLSSSLRTLSSPIFSPCSQAESIHHPKSVSGQETRRRRRCCQCLKSVQTDSQGGKQIDHIVIRRGDAA